MVDSVGTYSVLVSDSIGCTTSDTLNVLTGLAPSLSLGPDRSICGSDVVLSSGVTDTLTSILWSNGATTPDVTVTQTGTYSVVLSNNCGSSADTVFLIIIPDPEGYLLPNVFSPNGDGINDIFKADTGIPLTDFELTIFDRWGVRKFFTTDPFFTWGGLTEGGGNPVPEGVYFITFRAHDCAGDRVIRSGNLTVVR
jgi:gliding motility-associated-like protein